MRDKMNRIAILALLTLIATTVFAGEDVKEADLAGSWYPSSGEKLSSMLKGYIDGAELKKIPPNIIAAIVPHAGYIYSGPVAAYTFKAISKLDIDTIVIIGFSHKRYYDAISVYDRGVFQTPLGPLTVDEGLARQLILSGDKFYFNPEAFKGENSVEMQLPFIKYVFGDRDIKIVPIAIGVQSYENAELLGIGLYRLLKDEEKYLIIASTDMSHYHNYSEANTIDSVAVEALKRFDPKEFYNKVSLGKCEACGMGAVVAAMIAAKKLGADNIEVLRYANSGDVTLIKNSVVGYISAVLYKKGEVGQEAPNLKKEESGMLNEVQKKRLLQIAREAMEMYVRTRIRLNVKEDDPILNKEMGAFVTLHKNGRLRGCIGNIVGKGPLYLTVRDMAIEASTADPRFPIVVEQELKDIDIEVSVLSELKKVTDVNQIIMGKHGVIVKSGFRSGVYLPQVATETGWSREEFMSSLCANKAGLPPDAWKNGEADIFVFTAEVFGERD